MATFGDMKTWVAKRLQDPSGTAISSSDVGDMINQAINYWKNTRFWFNENTDETTLLEQDPSVPLPDDWLIPSISEAFVIEYSGIRYPLKKVSEAQYNAMYLSNGIGQPWWYSRQATSGFKVYPIPDRDYTLRRFFIKDYADLSADGDTNDWTTLATNMIQYQALAYGMSDFRQDFDLADKYRVQVDREYKSLMNITRKNNATGCLTVSSMLTSY